MTPKQKRDEYLALHCHDQLTPLIEQYVKLPRHVHSELCVHHVFGRGKYGEHWTNYVTVGPAAHDWCHAESVAGRMLCLWLKWKLSEHDERHLDLDVLKAVSGYHVVGWVEMKLDCVPAWCRSYGEEFLEGNE